MDKRSKSKTWRDAALVVARTMREDAPSVTKHAVSLQISRYVEGAPRSVQLIQRQMREWERGGEIGKRFGQG